MGGDGGVSDGHTSGHERDPAIDEIMTDFAHSESLRRGISKAQPHISSFPLVPLFRIGFCNSP